MLRLSKVAIYIFGYLVVRLLQNPLSVPCWVEATQEDEVRVVISPEQLASMNGKDGSDMWLSILGHVYNVTAGEEYYAEGGPYEIFVGRDGSAAFVTGDFTPEGAAKDFLEELETHQILQMEDWRIFYEEEEKYPFVGYLQGDLFDESGTPTERWQRVQEIIEKGREERAEKDRLRAIKIEERKKQREARLAAEATDKEKSAEL